MDEKAEGCEKEKGTGEGKDGKTEGAGDGEIRVGEKEIVGAEVGGV